MFKIQESHSEIQNGSFFILILGSNNFDKMKKLILTIAVLIGGIFIYAFSPTHEAHETLAIGSKAPLTDFKMNSTSGENTSLNDIKKSKGTLVVFSCNTCPFVIAWEDRYPELAELSEKNNIGMVLINSNEAKREGDDSIEKMKSHAKEKGYESISYLVDPSSKLANAFGAKTTPHIFLFDNNWELVYEGAIDDNYKSKEEVTAKYLENALNNLSAGKTIDPNDTKAIGCSIKRVKK